MVPRSAGFCRAALVDKEMRWKQTLTLHVSSNRPARHAVWRVGALFGISSALTVLSLMLFIITPALYRATSAWPGYYTVVTPHDAADALSRLEGTGVSGAISAARETVSISRFVGVEQVRVADIPNRLDPRDPRLDPYVTGITRYFTADDGDHEYSIVYVPHAGGAVQLAGRVRAALGREAMVLEWRPLPLIASLVVFGGAFALTVTMMVRSRGAAMLDRVLVVAGGVPWIPFVVFGGVVAAAVAGALYYLWSLIAAELFEATRAYWNYGRRIQRETVQRAVWYALASAASFGYAVAVGAGSLLASLAVAVAGTAGVVGVGAAWLVFRWRRQDHRLFLPVTIAGSAKRAVAAPLLALAVLVLPPVAARIGGRAPVAVPRPTATVDSYECTYPGLAALFEAALPNAAPNLADYVAHAAYQQALMFGRPYRMPVSGEQVELTRYHVADDGLYRPYQEIQLVFDASWLSDVLSVPGLPQLLRMGGEPSGVVVTRMPELYSRYPQLLQHSVFVFLVFGPFLLGGIRWSRHTSVLDPIKRRRQVA